MKRAVAVLAAVGLAAAPAQAQGLLGLWQTPDGGLVTVYRCADKVCAKVAQVSRDTTDTTDVMNPRAELKGRALCGLEVGRQFSLIDDSHAEGGELYDPNTGKTYRGSMAMDGDRLKLRGYIGSKLFGRTEVWTRASKPPASCGR